MTASAVFEARVPILSSLPATSAYPDGRRIASISDAMGLGDRWSEIAHTYADVNRAFGEFVKVTPSSKVVGDMAIFLVTHGLTMGEFEALGPGHELTGPNSVIDMFSGSLGRPAGGWPKRLQTMILGIASP